MLAETKQYLTRPSVVTTQPNEFDYDFTTKSTGDVNGAGTGTTSDSGHNTISNDSGTTTAKLVIRDSAFDGARVCTNNDVTNAHAVYLYPTGPGGTGQAFTNAVVYGWARYRYLSYSTFTATNSAIIHNVWSSTSFSATQSGNHTALFDGSISANTYVAPSPGEVNKATYTTTTVNNSWREVEFALNRATGDCVIRGWDGATHTYNDALVSSTDGRFPTFEWFSQTTPTTNRRIELAHVKAATFEAMSASQQAYFNALLATQGIAAVVPPTVMTPGTPVFFDFTGLSNTTGLTGLPAGWTYPNTGSSRGMHINSALAVGSSFGNYGNSAYRTDWLYASNNQRVTLAVGEPMNTKSYLQQAIIHAASTGGLQGWFGNSQTPTIYAESALGGSAGSPGTSRASAGFGTNYNGTSDFVSIESYGRVKISRYNGTPVVKWFDSGSLTTVGSGNRLLAFALESDADGKGVGSVKFEDMGTNGYSPSKITKDGSAPTITTSFATITGWVATDTAATAYTSNTVTVPGFTTILSGNGFQVIAGGSPVVTLTASIPYTGLSGGGSNKVRIMKNGTQVGSDGATQSGASGTCTCTVSSLTVAPEDVITVQITGSAGTPGTVTASTPTLTLT